MDKKLLLFPLLLVLIAASAAAQPTVQCESIDGKRAHCRADTRDGVALVRQISESPCVMNQTWGYDRDGIWVTGGCRGEFTLASNLGTAGFASPTVICESIDGMRTICRADTRHGVTLARQISNADCVMNRTWGYDRDGIWVTEGCRGEFTLVSDQRAAPMPAATVLCESIDGRRAHCRADTTHGVTLARQISNSDCVMNRTWGYDRDGIWVTEGCRAEFTLASDRRIAPMPAATVLCESIDGKRAHCRADTRFGVTLARQISNSDCVMNRTWGYDRDGIWVTEGCRAEFTLASDRRVAPMPAATVLCESIDGRRAHCRADTRYGVTLARQVSDSACVMNQTWGYDRDGIWVSGGCRAEFALGDDRRAPATRPLTLICESIDGRRNHCRVDTTYGVTLTRQISNSDCVMNRTWGYDRDGIWVTDGCRAEFTIADRPIGGRAAVGVDTIVCESIDGRRNHCRADTRTGVRLLRQISNAECVMNQTWGYDADGIWVTKGCRGEFTFANAPTRTSPPPRTASVTCESKDGKRNVCPADTRLGVAVVRQLSDSPCVHNSTWGYDADGIWVTAGCRAEFVLRR